MARKFKNGVWPIADVLDIFKEELEAKELCATGASQSNRRESSQDNDQFSTMNLFSQQKRDQRDRRERRQIRQDFSKPLPNRWAKNC